jgi:general secretion pathway protein C
MVTLSRGNSAGWAPQPKLAKAAVVAATLLVWALAMGSALYWGMQLSTNRSTDTAPPQVVQQANADPDAVARLLGARAPSPAMQASLASRFALQGVVAGGPGGGAALISIDGKPAKAVPVGSTLEDGLILQSASARTVTLAESRNSPVLLTLEMPQLR